MSVDRLALLLGDFIEHHRIEKNMYQEELGVAMGLSILTISLIECVEITSWEMWSNTRV